MWGGMTGKLKFYSDYFVSSVELEVVTFISSFFSSIATSVALTASTCAVSTASLTTQL